VELKLAWFDEVGSYPANFNLDISRTIPPEIWAKWPPKTEDDNRSTAPK
jgi:hypothetical protein